jgi:hypothetical protein
MEKAMRYSKQRSAGVPQDTRQQNQLPDHHLVEVSPIAGGSLEVLNAMLSGKL